MERDSRKEGLPVTKTRKTGQSKGGAGKRRTEGPIGGQHRLKLSCFSKDMFHVGRPILQPREEGSQGRQTLERAARSPLPLSLFLKPLEEGCATTHYSLELGCWCHPSASSLGLLSIFPMLANSLFACVVHCLPYAPATAANRERETERAA